MTTPDIGTFLESIYGTEDSGYIEFKTDGFETSRWFAWPDQRKYIVTYLGMRRDEDVWLPAMLFSEKDRHAENATVTKAVYMDADACPPERFRLKPSYVIETSEGHWQCWWLLDKTYPAEDVSEIAHKIAVAHKPHGCDPSGWIPAKMMRVPGSTNTKYDIPFRVRYDERYEPTVYTMSDLLDAYGDISLERAAVVNDELPSRLPRTVDVVGEFAERCPDLFDLYRTDVPEGGSWSERMWRLLMGMLDAGFSREEIFVVAKNARCNKYDPEHAGKMTQKGSRIPLRQDPDGTLWREVLKAEAEYQKGERAPEPEVVVVEDDDTEMFGFRQKSIKASFLTDDERALVADQPSFIDEYVAWVKTRTDAAERYQRSLAYLLLSCVYGNLGYISPQFGRMDLNLWLMILGDTTFTRKSTSRSLFLKVLHEFERATSQQVDIGSDFTPEGLTRELSERPNQVSLVHRDEIQGWFHEIYNKTYMSGSIERMTDLYDGRVMGTLRAGKDASIKTRAQVVFNILGMGIKDEIARVLTDDHFKSGFLARFLWASAETPQVTRDLVLVKQREVDHDSISHDEFIDETVMWFEERLIALGAADGQKTKMLMDEVTMERYNEWVLQISGVTDPSFRNVSDTVKPSTERLRYSVWKAAALLAIHEGSPRIEIRHLLHVLAQAELWYEDMTLMAGAISSSEYERQVNDLINYVATASNGQRTKAAVYRKFAAWRVNVVELWLDTAIKTGMLIDTGSHLVMRGREND